MRQNRDRSAHLDRAVLLFLLALFVLVSSFKGVWATPALPWFTPYLLWGGIIVLAFRLRRRDHDEF